MSFTLANIVLVFGAGFASLLSPCVLPVVPIIVTGTEKDHHLRPILVVAGLSLTFMLMGVVSSIFGSFIGSKLYYVEKVISVMIIVFGIMMLVDVNIFKKMTFLTRMPVKSKGRFGGFFLGLMLGVIWIPCVGPLLSGVLAMVASNGKIAGGIFLLLIYSIGFSIPLLIAGYAAQIFRNKVYLFKTNPLVIRVISGSILIILGTIILTKGMVGFSLL